MQGSQSTKLAQARVLTLYVGRWLDLLDFQAHQAAPPFSPSVSTYHDMLDPNGTDAARLAACWAMQHHVRRRAEAERMHGEAAYARLRPVDPYGHRWRTTREGAALETIASMLSSAIELFSSSTNEAAR
ncbi:hypothetical protein FDP25_13750 [Roseovarius sp. A21]|uniref:Uncharacterized protein n=1 Tax=Roseovarius bejariae TaxID=2576383 RepID=A0A844CPG7_9RHOB|nr:hypothetical protein [Roseovarius bejariae]MRU16502.1 hypothetical protein [Roseovarius bejariae]